MKKLVLVVPLLLVIGFACSSVKNFVVKDLALEEQQALMDEYKDRYAWTRIVLEDVGEGGSIARDTKIKIVDIGMVYGGTITVETLKKRNKVRHDLDLESPLSRKSIDEKLTEIFWFEDPVLRQVAYIRKWGKKVARAIVDHEVFIGMPAEAAVESWGYPATTNVNEIGGKLNEQWVYPSGKRNKYIYVTDGNITKWED